MFLLPAQRHGAAGEQQQDHGLAGFQQCIQQVALCLRNTDIRTA